jgi:hypothetical protein
MPDWAKWPPLKIDEHGGVSEGGSEMSKIGGSDAKNPLYKRNQGGAAERIHAGEGGS